MAGTSSPPPSPGTSVSAGTSPSAVYKPNEPKMGGLQQTGGTDYVPWVGGKPKHDWSDLASAPSIIHPTMLRPTSAGSSQKSQAYRVQGMTEKYGHGNDLLEFQAEVIRHFERYGMDTITYVEDPAAKDPAKTPEMVSIVAHHTKYTMDSATTAVAGIETSYDEYDKANVEDAKLFIENSLTKELAKELNQVAKRATTFVEYWMYLIEIVHIPGTDHFEKLKSKMRTRKIKDYAGEDVLAMAQDLLDDHDQLHDASMYDHNLTLSAIKAIMEGSAETRISH